MGTENQSSDDPLASISERDAVCPACGYDLRGLTRDTCPECGLAVNAESIAKVNLKRKVRWTRGLNAVVLSTASVWAAATAHLLLVSERGGSWVVVVPFVVTLLGVPVIGVHVLVRPDPGPRAVWRTALEVVSWMWSALVVSAAVWMMVAVFYED